MSDDLAKRARDAAANSPSRDLLFKLADRIEELEADLADAESRANAFATKEMHTAKDRDEALNQLNSALHSIDVLEAKVERLKRMLAVRRVYI